MTVTQFGFRLSRSFVLGLAVLVLVAAPVLAHAELVSSTPADGATVAGSPDEIVAVFDEPLEDNSSMTVHDAAGARVAVGAVDSADRTRLVIDSPQLSPGDYEVRMTAASADGHIDHPRFSFTVVAPTPSPTAAPTATPRATPSLTPTPAPSPTPSGNGSGASGAADVLLPLLSVLIAIVALGAFLLRNRRVAGR